MTRTAASPLPPADISDTDTEAAVRRALGLSGPSSHSTPHAPQSQIATRPAIDTNHRQSHSPDHQRRRFVRDGEVTVEMVGRRDAAAEAAFGPSAGRNPRRDQGEGDARVERDARLRAEQSLAEALAHIRDLQTKLGHASLAVDEARGQARDAQSRMQALEAELAESRAAHEAAEAALRKARSLEPEMRRPVGRPRLRPLIWDEPSNGELELVPEAESAPETVRAIRKPKAAAAPRASGAPPAKRGRPPKSAEPQPIKWWIKPKAGR